MRIYIWAFSFLVLKSSIYLNTHAFVMDVYFTVARVKTEHLNLRMLGKHFISRLFMIYSPSFPESRLWHFMQVVAAWFQRRQGAWNVKVCFFFFCLFFFCSNWNKIINLILLSSFRECASWKPDKEDFVRWYICPVIYYKKQNRLSYVINGAAHILKWHKAE